MRDQLNRGVVPDGIDLHCLAELIKVCSIAFPFSFILYYLCFVNMANSCVHRLALSFSVILICTEPLNTIYQTYPRINTPTNMLRIL